MRHGFVWIAVGSCTVSLLAAAGGCGSHEPPSSETVGTLSMALSSIDATTQVTTEVEAQAPSTTTQVTPDAEAPWGFAPRRVGDSAASVAQSQDASSEISDASSPAHLTRQEWRQTLLAARLQAGDGCFEATYPSTTWKARRCTPVPAVTPGPHAARTNSPGPAAGGGGPFDYSAVMPYSTNPGLFPIKQAIGSFPKVVGATREVDTTTNIPNNYSLQLNSNIDTSTSSNPVSACDGGGGNCQVWQQFLYDNNVADSGTATFFIQYWMFGYGSTCPPPWSLVPAGPFCIGSGPCCQILTSGTLVDGGQVTLAQQQPVTNLSNVLVMGLTTSLGDIMAVEIAPPGQSPTITSTPVIPNKLNLDKWWNGAEFNVFGFQNQSAALFDGGPTIAVQTLVSGGWQFVDAGPQCTATGWTGEANNLALSPAPEAGVTCGAFPGSLAATQQGALAVPGILFTESNAGNNNVHQLVYPYSGSWNNTNFTTSIGSPVAPPASSISALDDEANNGSGYLSEHIFYINSQNNHVFGLGYPATVGSWAQIDLTGVAQGSPPSAAACSGLSSYTTSDGAHAVYTGTDQHVHQLYFQYANNPNNAWIDQDLTSKSGGLPVAACSALSTFVSGGEQHVVYFGVNGDVLQSWYSGGGWYYQDLTAGYGGTPPITSQGLTTFLTPSGEQHVAYVGTDRYPKQMWYTPGGSWSTQGLPAYVVASNTGLSSYANSSSQAVFYVDGNLQDVNVVEYIPGTGWINFDFTQEGIGPQAAYASGVTTFLDRSGIVHVAYVGSDTNVHQNWGSLPATGEQWSSQPISSGSAGSAGSSLASFGASDGQHVFFLSPN